MVTLPYPISANRYWRPVPIGKHITIVPTKEAKEYKKAVAWIARKAGIQQPIAWRFIMHLQLYPHRPLDWAKREKADPYWEDDVRCIDLGNCEKVVSDALQGVLYTDDRWIWRQTKDRMLPDSGEARVVVTITPMVKEPPRGTLL